VCLFSGFFPITTLARTSVKFSMGQARVNVSVPFSVFAGWHSDFFLVCDVRCGLPQTPFIWLWFSLLDLVWCSFSWWEGVGFYPASLPLLLRWPWAVLSTLSKEPHGDMVHTLLLCPKRYWSVVFWWYPRLFWASRVILLFEGKFVKNCYQLSVQYWVEFAKNCYFSLHACLIGIEIKHFFLFSSVNVCFSRNLSILSKWHGFPIVL
jgi:hypothetical protein